MLLLLKYPVPCLDWKIYIYIFLSLFQFVKNARCSVFFGGIHAIHKIFRFFMPVYTVNYKWSYFNGFWKKELQPMRSLCNLTSTVTFRKNLYRNKLKLTTIFDKPVTRTPCALLPVLQKIHLTIVNLSRKEKNAKISFENYKASKIWKKKRKKRIYRKRNYERNRSLN